MIKGKVSEAFVYDMFEGIVFFEVFQLAVSAIVIGMYIMAVIVDHSAFEKLGVFLSFLWVTNAECIVSFMLLTKAFFRYVSLQNSGSFGVRLHCFYTTPTTTNMIIPASPPDETKRSIRL